MHGHPTHEDRRTPFGFPRALTQKITQKIQPAPGHPPGIAHRPTSLPQALIRHTLKNHHRPSNPPAWRASLTHHSPVRRLSYDVPSTVFEKITVTS